MKPVIELQNINLDYNYRQSLTVKTYISNLLRKTRREDDKIFRALESVTLSFEKGKVYCVIGNNGAGKSTLLKVLAGIISPSSGILVNRAKSIGLLSLGASFSRELTGKENIFLNGLLLGISKKYIEENIQKIIDFSEINDFIDRPVRTYSSGMVARLGFSIAINLKPQVLLIDEVLSVGDIHFKEKSSKALVELIKSKNKTVVIVSHDMSTVVNLCDEAIWLEKGRVIKVGQVQAVVDEYIAASTKRS